MSVGRDEPLAAGPAWYDLNAMTGRTRERLAYATRILLDVALQRKTPDELAVEAKRFLEGGDVK